MKKKIVLLGDSIRLIGYGTVLPSLLEKDFDVWQPEENGMFVQNVFRELFKYSDEIEKADIVHFNAGQWDVCDIYGDGTFTPVDFYVSYIIRIADVLLKKGKTVVFATTTPVRDPHEYNSNSDIVRFNDAAVSALKGRNVIINDMYSVIAEDTRKYVRSDDKIHLTEEGIMRAAQSTAELLLSLK